MPRRDTAAVAALDDPVRRQLYLFVRSARRPVTRDEAAAAVGVSRKLAAFHLDKLIDRGLLRFHYARSEGRGGPGAGRPAKRYEPSDIEVEVSIPERHYEMVGRLLVRAISQADEEPADRAATKVAEEEGVRAGERIRRARRLRSPRRERALAVAEETLRETGYEPYRQEDGGIRLYNCPFHILAREAPELVCGMNRAFLGGLLDGLRATDLEAVLEPTPGECCVVIR